MRTIVEIDGATLLRAYFKTGLILVSLFFFPLLLVFFLIADRGGWYFLLFAFVMTFVFASTGLAVSAYLDRKRLVLVKGSISQLRGDKEIAEIPLEGIEKLRVYAPRGSVRLFGLDRVVLVSRSGKEIRQLCGNADPVIGTFLEITGRPDIPVKWETGPKRWHWAAGLVLFAGAISFMYWGHTSGRGDLVNLFVGLMLCGFAVSFLVFRPMSSRGQSRKAELVLGGLFLLQASLAFYQFADFQLSDYTERGMRYACTRRFELARKALRQAGEADEPASRLAYGWGVLHFYEKDYPQAEEELLAALQADPALNDARYQLSRTYWCMGRKDEARALLEQYLDLGGGKYTSAARKALKEEH